MPESVSQIYYIYGEGDADLSDYGHSLDPRQVGGGISPAATLLTLFGCIPRALFEARRHEVREPVSDAHFEAGPRQGRLGGHGLLQTNPAGSHELAL